MAIRNQSILPLMRFLPRIAAKTSNRLTSILIFYRLRARLIIEDTNDKSAIYNGAVRKKSL
jgi:hypothetical protein